jgi:hypothetical protein
MSETPLEFVSTEDVLVPANSEVALVAMTASVNQTSIEINGDNNLVLFGFEPDVAD